MQRPNWDDLCMSGISRCWCFRLSGYASSGHGSMYSSAESILSCCQSSCLLYINKAFIALDGG